MQHKVSSKSVSELLHVKVTMGFLIICRYIGDQALTLPVIVYLQPQVTEFFGLAAWHLTNDESILVCPIPPNVFGWLDEAELGLFKKVCHQLQPQLLKRYLLTFTPGHKAM